MSEKEINGIKLYRRRGPWRIIAYFVALTLLIAPSVIFCFKDDTDWVEPTIITSKNIGSYSVSDEDIWFRYDLMEKYFGYEHISFKNSGGMVRFSDVYHLASGNYYTDMEHVLICRPGNLLPVQETVKVKSRFYKGFITVYKEAHYDWDKRRITLTFGDKNAPPRYVAIPSNAVS